ncbi:molybdopterin converting factor subunit 1 [Peribacillus sp. SCS-37]|uniref:molybdopterin converting factor subunit 1 n=1 Tax=Paraperibacillus esterisolvens TaxID=3115296 RepID=UPI003905935B
MIKVLFFAGLKETAETGSISVDMNGRSLGDLKKAVEEQFSLQLGSVMAAVNEEFADDDTILEAGDTVAFIPPVSGG